MIQNPNVKKKRYAVKDKGINEKLFSNFPPQIQPV